MALPGTPGSDAWGAAESLLLIDGKLVPASGGATYENINPATGKVVGVAPDASLDDIELAMTYGVNYPKGLLYWADQIGIANVVGELDRLHGEYLDPRYRCSPLLRRMAHEEKNFF